MNLIETTIDKAIIKAGTDGGSLDIQELAEKIGIDAEEVCDIITGRWIGTGKLAITDGDLRDAQMLNFSPLRLSADCIRQLTFESKAYEGVKIDDLGDGTDTRQLLSIGRETITRTITHDVEGDGFFSVAIHEHMEAGAFKFSPVLLASETMLPDREAAEEFAENWKAMRLSTQNFHGLVARVEPSWFDCGSAGLIIRREESPEDAPPIFEKGFSDVSDAWCAWSDYKFEQFLGQVYTQAPAEPEEPTAEELAAEDAEDPTLQPAAVEEPAAEVAIDHAASDAIDAALTESEDPAEVSA